ncbi:MAG: crossover junction endodeoxyribonuclease RuvC [Actinobacteria bacterium]|nr:crossover junction endodeoxyribonuclease RuvC [Actinomycetota bacterium]
MIVLGIDPGVATTGYGVISTQGSKMSLCEYGVIKTAAKQPLETRLITIRREMTQILAQFKPDTMGIEDLFFNHNTKTAMMVAQGRGVLLLTGAEAGIPIHSYTPPQIKLGVSGYGSAPKQQVQKMVKSLLNLPKIPRPDDAADALAVAICHAHSLRMRTLGSTA